MGVGIVNKLEISFFKTLQTESATRNKADSTVGKPGSFVLLGASGGRPLVHCLRLVKSEWVGRLDFHRGRKSFTLCRYYGFGLE